MKTILRALIAGAFWAAALTHALAGSGTITTKDAGGTTRTFDVVTDGSGNFISETVICDQSAAATCASVGTAGSPSTNALTVQAVTLGHGTAANAMRVELPTDGTGIVGLATGSNTIGAVTQASGPWTANVTQFGGSNIVAAAAGVPRVGLADGSGNAVTSQNANSHVAPDVVINDASGNRLNGLVTGTQASPSTQVLTTTLASQYPGGSTPITASATGTTAATTATLAANASKTTYLCGFSIRANATAAATGNATVTGTITGTLNFTQWTAPLASGLGLTEPPIGPSCIPGSAINTAIAVISAAPGSGGVVSVSAWGYQL